MAVINSPFESQYGFKGPGFSVDEFGNITATSIITNSGVVEDTDIVDFTITETESADAFLFNNLVGNNPTITLARSKSYKFSITVPGLTFNIYNSDQETLYSTGLRHSDGSVGPDVQGKTSGIVEFLISTEAPNTLYYGNDVANVFGTINIVDPIGVFSTVDVNSTIASTSSLNGALTVAGGVGIEGDLYVGGTLNIDGIGITTISSPTNLELEAANHIVIKIDGTSLGIIKSTGSTIPVVDTNINNTVIGATAPAAAAFTSATVLETTTADSSVTNRQYVDSTALSLAIAFGL